MAEKFHYFWGGPFSQWERQHPFTVKGITYLTAEHYMMWFKDQVFGGELSAEILACRHPRDAKMLGRMIKNFDANVWNACAKQGVFVGNMAKFTQHPEFLEYMLDTEGYTRRKTPFGASAWKSVTHERRNEKLGLAPIGWAKFSLTCETPFSAWNEIW